MISTTRTTFQERWSILHHTLSESFVIDKSPADIKHNEQARFLRNGLAIISFNILEDFIKNRIGEVLQHIATSAVQFNRLPEKLQIATLLNPLRGINKIAGRMKANGGNWKMFVQDQAQILSTSVSSPYRLTGYGMGFSESNLEANDINEFLSAFQVDGGWQSIDQLTSIIGCAVVASKQVFINAANRRHTAAHDPNTQTPYTDILDFVNFVKPIALAFDFLISQAAHNLINNHSAYIGSARKIVPADLQIRYIRKASGVFHEMAANNTTSIKRFPNEATAVASLIARRNYHKEMIVVIDYPSHVESWYTAL